MNKLARTALLAAFTATAAVPAIAQEGAPRLTPAQTELYMKQFFENDLGRIVADAAQAPGPLSAGACYTLNDGLSLQQFSGMGLGIEGHIELLTVMERRDGKVFYSDGDEMKVDEHFDSVASFAAKYRGLTVIPGDVTIGCYDSAYDAERDRDRLNKAAVKLYRDDIRAKFDQLTIK